MSRALSKRILHGGPFDGQMVFYSNRFKKRFEMSLGDRNSVAAIAPELADKVGSGGKLVAVYIRKPGEPRWNFSEIIVKEDEE